jgi:dTDP-glucose pyrophosphorylase
VRSCRERLRPGRFLCLNGDDLFGARDLARLARCEAGVIVHEVDEPRQFGIAFRKPDGSLEKLVEKPDLPGPLPANTGAYVFPGDVFDIPLSLSPRGEYEITDYVTGLAQKGRVELIESTFWLPIGTVEIWQAAQNRDDIETAMKGDR